jgi:MYXO-CTERM domain-containing protein
MNIRLLTALALLSPAPALACGGFFCGSITLEPVQQNAERILFEINGDGTITTNVEISYTGDPAGFSWVVPVPVTPSLDVDTPADVMALLDDATRPQIIPPPTRCSQAPLAPGVFAETNLVMADDGAGRVGVEDLPQVGPFQPQVIESDDADALIEWLNDNDYLITPQMEPVVADYVAQDMKFLAMKLAPGSEVADITPIGITFAADEPMIPIQLTGVAAEPEMGVLAFIAGDERYESTNWQNLEIDVADVRAHPRNGAENYYPLVSWQIDQAGGQAFVTQSAGPLTDATQQAINSWSWNEEYADSIARLEQLQNQYGYLTRLYARASAWEMLSDPSFAPTTGGDVDRFLDLSDQPEVEVCAGEGRQAERDTACGQMYCGEGATCATTDGWGDACVCPEGTVAREINESRVSGGTTVPTVTCERLDSDLFEGVLTSGVAFEDPCADAQCGENGTCELVNGFATCACESGFAAAATGLGTPICVTAQNEYSAEQLLWNSGCSCNTSGKSAVGVFGLLALGLLGVRRRR